MPACAEQGRFHMKKVILPLSDGFEEIEAVTIIDILRRAGIQVVVAGLKEGTLKGSRRLLLMPDVLLDQVKDEAFDAVVLPGGQPGVDNLRRDVRVLELVKRMDREKKLIGAICAAPLVLRDAGIIRGVKMTSYPGMNSEFKESRYEENRLVLDSHVITSRGPATAMDFALKLAEILAGPEQAAKVAEAVLIRE